MKIINVLLAKPYDNVNSLPNSKIPDNSLTFQSKKNSSTFPDFPESGNHYSTMF